MTLLRGCAVVVASLALRATAASSIPPPRDDERLQDAIDRTLSAMLGDPALEITVRATGPVVTLSGTAATTAVQWMAEDAARAVEGVQEVRSVLAIDAEAGSDSELASQVLAVLDAAV